MTEDIEELLFNLANNDRLTLLARISEQRQRLTSLAKAINASNQECSRHLNRLSNSGYVKKDPDGAFENNNPG